MTTHASHPLHLIALCVLFGTATWHGYWMCDAVLYGAGVIPHAVGLAYSTLFIGLIAMRLRRRC